MTEVGKTCNICHKRPGIYERVRHCRKCHSEYCKANYERMKQRVKFITDQKEAS